MSECFEIGISIDVKKPKHIKQRGGQWIISFTKETLC